MIKYKEVALATLLVLCTAGGAWAVDNSLMIAPLFRQFPVTTLYDGVATAQFTITNTDADAVPLSLAISGVSSAEFAIVNDATTTCGSSLAAGASCNITVAFQPRTRGTKTAELEVTSGDKVLRGFLSNISSNQAQAQSRLPAVMTELVLRDLTTPDVEVGDTLYAGHNYQISWALEGYGTDYSSEVVLFDCTADQDDDCGSEYTDQSRFAASGSLVAGSRAAGGWNYQGLTDTVFTYTWTFRVPTDRLWPANGGDVVLRFYALSDTDAERGSPAVSLVVPGGQGVAYYDTSGRRIVMSVKP